MSEYYSRNTIDAKFESLRSLIQSLGNSIADLKESNKVDFDRLWNAIESQNKSIPEMYERINKHTTKIHENTHKIDIVSRDLEDLKHEFVQKNYETEKIIKELKKSTNSNSEKVDFFKTREGFIVGSISFLSAVLGLILSILAITNQL